MSKIIEFGLGEWYYLTWLVQGRRNELISKQYKWDKDYKSVEIIELSDVERKELSKCEELYKSLNKQAGLGSN